MSTTKQSVSKAPQSQSKYFISAMNSMIGQALVEQLRNDNENDVNPHIIVGTKYNDDEIPRGATTFIDQQNPQILAKVILDCDGVIFDLHHSNVEEAEFALKILKHGSYTEKKVLVLLSSALSWSNTPMKEKSDSQRGSVNQELQEQDPEMANIMKKYARLTESDLHLRKPNKKYERMRELEMRALNVANKRKNLKIYVLSSGIVYGNGEDILFDLFKKAWMKPDEELPIIGDGSNIIPMIHVADLAELVQKTIDICPEQSYLFAVDHDTANTQRRIVTSIAQGIATGRVKHITSTEAYMDPSYDLLTLNVWFKPTSVFDQADETQFQDAKLNPIINWHCKEGLQKNIIKVRSEFKLYRGLQTVKTVVIGPSGSGMSYYATKIAKKYKIPHITIKPLVEQVCSLNTPFGNEIRETLKSIQEKMTEEALAQFELDKKKKKVPKGQPEPEFDASKIVPRLPDEELIRVYKWRLDQNDAQNLGYVLDNFPKNATQAESLFMKKIVKEDETEEYIKEDTFLPQSAFMLNPTDEEVKEAIKERITPEELAASRYNDEALNKRLAAFRGNQEGIIDFYQQMQTGLVQGKELDEWIELIEKDGKIMVLEGDEEEVEEVKDQGIKEQEEEEGESKKEEEAKQDQTKKEAQLAINKTKESITKSDVHSSRLTVKQKGLEDSKKVVVDEETRQEQLRAQEREILDTRSQPLRQYLADNVVPYLTEGLIEICREIPDDPVSYLADYLEQKGRELQGPFPNQ